MGHKPKFGYPKSLGAGGYHEIDKCLAYKWAYLSGRIPSVAAVWRPTQVANRLCPTKVTPNGHGSLRLQPEQQDR